MTVEVQAAGLMEARRVRALVVAMAAVAMEVTGGCGGFGGGSVGGGGERGGDSGGGDGCGGDGGGDGGSSHTLLAQS